MSRKRSMAEIMVVEKEEVMVVEKEEVMVVEKEEERMVVEKEEETMVVEKEEERMVVEKEEERMVEEKEEAEEAEPPWTWEERRTISAALEWTPLPTEDDDALVEWARVVTAALALLERVRLSDGDLMEGVELLRAVATVASDAPFVTDPPLLRRTVQVFRQAKDGVVAHWARLAFERLCEAEVTAYREDTRTDVQSWRTGARRRMLQSG